MKQVNITQKRFHFPQLSVNSTFIKRYTETPGTITVFTRQEFSYLLSCLCVCLLVDNRLKTMFGLEELGMNWKSRFLYVPNAQTHKKSRNFHCSFHKEAESWWVTWSWLLWAGLVFWRRGRARGVKVNAGVGYICTAVRCCSELVVILHHFNMDMFPSNSSQINTTLPPEDWTTVSSHSKGFVY